VATSILGILGVLGLGLAAMGLYSVMAYSVAQRTNEIGIRVALGAQPPDVIAMVMRQGMGLVAAGLLAGTIAAFVLARLASSTDTMVRPADPQSYAVAALFTLLIAALAVAVPAWRALRVDPIEALRNP